MIVGSTCSQSIPTSWTESTVSDKYLESEGPGLPIDLMWCSQKQNKASQMLFEDAEKIA